MSKKEGKTPEKGNDIITRGRSSSVLDVKENSTLSPAKMRKVKGQPLASDIFIDEKGRLFLEECERSPVKLEKMVNSKEFADTIFTVGGAMLYAHKAIIEVRCPTLFAVNLKDRPSKKGSISTYKIDDKLFDDTTLLFILYYLYTDAVQFSLMGPIDVVMLIKAAEVYELNRLVWLCERYLRYVITDELFFTLLKSSNTMNVVRAKNICMDYGKQHFTELIGKRDEVHSLGIELFREFVVFTHIGGVEVEDPESKTMEPTIAQDLQKVFKDRHHCDGTFVFGDQTVECHRAILLAQSDKLLKVLKPEGDPNALQLPKEQNMSAQAFDAALSFMYYRDTTFNADYAAEIIPFALEFDIQPLFKECEAKIKAGINVESVIPILSLCYNKDTEKFVKKEMLGPCFNFITNNFVKIDFTSLKKKTPKMVADILRIVKKQITIGKWTKKSSHSDEGVSSDPESEVKQHTSPFQEKMEKTNSKASVEGSVDAKEEDRSETVEVNDAEKPVEETPTTDPSEEKSTTPKPKKKSSEKRDSTKKTHERKESSGKKKKQKD